MTDPNRPDIADRPNTPGAPPGEPPPERPRRSSGALSVLFGAAAAVVVAFGGGVVAGAFYMGLAGYQLNPPQASNNMPAMQPGMPTPGTSGMPPGPGAPGMPRGPNPKMQLAGLVAKLDVLTEKPLSVKLTDEQRKQVQEQLKGLANAEELSDDDAKAKLDKILDVLKDDKETFEAAGYRWPGAAGPGGFPGMGQQPPPNPFTTEANASHLKALSERLEKSS
jgi:hypothetical protein